MLCGFVGSLFFDVFEGLLEFVDELCGGGRIVLFAGDLHLTSDLGDLIEAITGSRTFELVPDVSDLVEVVGL